MIFEQSNDNIRNYCYSRGDCLGCPLMFKNGVCAKDLTDDGQNDLHELFNFLVKEVDI